MADLQMYVYFVEYVSKLLLSLILIAGIAL